MNLRIQSKLNTTILNKANCERKKKARFFSLIRYYVCKLESIRPLVSESGFDFLIESLNNLNLQNDIRLRQVSLSKLQNRLYALRSRWHTIIKAARCSSPEVRKKVRGHIRRTELTREIFLPGWSNWLDEQNNISNATTQSSSTLTVHNDQEYTISVLYNTPYATGNDVVPVNNNNFIYTVNTQV